MKIDEQARGRDDNPRRTALMTGGDRMRECFRGVIHTMASVLSFLSLPLQAVYAGSKSSIPCLTQAPAADRKSCGVHAACLSPGKANHHDGEDLCGDGFGVCEIIARPDVPADRDRQSILPYAKNQLRKLPKNAIYCYLFPVIHMAGSRQGGKKAICRG